MTPAAGYARVSTPRQAKEGYSLEAQEEAIRLYAERNDLHLLEVATDDLSGRRTDRPGLERLRQLAEAKQIRALVLLRLDRLARKAHIGAALVEWFSERGVSLLFVEQTFQDNPTGRFTRTIVHGVSELESDLIAERTDLGRRNKARELGRVPQGFRRFGVRSVSVAEATVDPSRSSGALLAVPGEAEIVLSLFEQYAAGGTLRSLLAWLETRGIRGLDGGRWTPHRLRELLRSEAYCDRWHYGRERIPVAGAGLVPRELWSDVQALLTANRHRHGGRVHTWGLAGCVRCSDCGCACRGRARVAPKKVYRYYGCYKCTLAARAEPLEAGALAWLLRELTPARVDRMLRGAAAGGEKGAATRREAERSLTAIEHEMALLLRKSVLGFPDTIVQRELAALNARRTAAEAVLASAPRPVDVGAKQRRAAALLERLRAGGLLACGPMLRRCLRVTIARGEAVRFEVEF